jgi:hypothetical protein
MKRTKNEVIVFIALIWASMLEFLEYMPCSFICLVWLHKDRIKNRKEVSDTTKKMKEIILRRV